MTGPLAIFRCDADETLGGGHAVRCLGLAEALEQDGWRVAFAVSSSTVRTVPTLAARAWQVIGGFDAGIDEIARYRAVWPTGADLVVIDHYRRDAADETVVSAWAAQRLVIDDRPTREHVCEFLVDQTIGRGPADYAHVVPPACTVLAGPAFAILRPAFAKARHRLRPRSSTPLERILISFGMVDAANLTATALSGLRHFTGGIDVVLGANAPHLPALRTSVANRPGPSVTIHAGLDDAAMASLLMRCDLAIGAPGISSYERCCLGVPTLAIVLADNQRDNVAGLEAAGVARSLGWWGNVSAEMIGEAVHELSISPQFVDRMRAAGLQQADGRGAQRIALALRPPRSREGIPVSLHPARSSDAEMLYRWQQAPETRRYARNPGVPTWPEHEKWLRTKLADPGTLLNIIQVGGVPAGVLRFDAADPTSSRDECFEISIFLNPDFYRQGIGLAALEAGRRLVPHAELQAVVLPTNEASHRLFQRAGYLPIGDRYRSMPVDPMVA